MADLWGNTVGNTAFGELWVGKHLVLGGGLRFVCDGNPLAVLLSTQQLAASQVRKITLPSWVNILLHTGAELDQLEELLSDIEATPDAMCVSELDGYVAGLLLCPDMILPNEWLPKIWGFDGEQEIQNMERAQGAIGAVMAHYDRVAAILSDGFESYEMVVEYPRHFGDPIWELWLAGFARAMSLRPDAWGAYMHTNYITVKAAFTFMESLIDIGAGESNLAVDVQDNIEDQIVEILPNLVVRMSRLHKSGSMPCTRSCSR